MNPHPEIKFAIETAFKKLEREKITPWVFLAADKMPPIEDFLGRIIQYKGVKFEGTPRQVFWGGFIEPFLEGVIAWGFQFALDHGKQRNLDVRSCILEARRTLSARISDVYRRMQDIDRRLLGKGYPETVPPHDISVAISLMNGKLDQYYDSANQTASALDGNSGKPAFSDALELKPGFSGISVDLKKLWEWIRARVMPNKGGGAGCV